MKPSSPGKARATDRAGSREKLLKALGAAIRARRLAQGMTMRLLAELADVSERFLVQLEGGEGNISVARLEDLGRALGSSGAELLAEASRPREDEVSVPVVALVGLRGAGKSTIGAAVAKSLGVPFVELDELIVREAQLPLATIFELHGETYYRKIERQVLRRVLAKREPLVVATGGSLVTDPTSWELLRSRARTVWLKARPEEHWTRVVTQGDVRPMRDRPKAMNELRALLAARGPLYEQASVTIDTSGRSSKRVAADVVAAARAC